MIDINRTLDALRRSRSVNEAAAELGIAPRTIRDRMAKAGLGSARSYIYPHEETTFIPPPPYLPDAPDLINLPSPRDAWIPGPLEKILVLPDVHVPYHDENCFQLFLKVAKGWRPQVLVILGDFYDFYSISGYPKDPFRKYSLHDELAIGKTYLDMLEELAIPRVIYCEGNHETRLARYLASNAPQLAGVTQAVQGLLDVSRRGWEWIKYGDYATVGKLHFAHDVGGAGPNAARAAVQAFGGCILFGHTHRASIYYESTVNGDRHLGATLGWLGDPSYIDYRHRARVLRENQHGFGVAYVDRNSKLGWVNFVPILDNKAVVDGMLYDLEQMG